ncbi:MAG: hypothetical protein R3B90_04955 [Planctomycetaceae bacterium]
MTSETMMPPATKLFRRVFLWTLCAFLLASAVRGDDSVPPMPAAAIEPAVVPVVQPHEVAPYGHAGNTSATFETPSGPWTVTIAPSAPRSGSVVGPTGLTYEQAYASIPYRRAEYLANPGYRHEAAMELMYGQLRPTTNVRQSNPQTIPLPQSSLYKPYMFSASDLYHALPPVSGRYGWGAFGGLYNGFGPQGIGYRALPPPSFRLLAPQYPAIY